MIIWRACFLALTSSKITPIFSLHSALALPACTTHTAMAVESSGRFTNRESKRVCAVDKVMAIMHGAVSNKQAGVCDKQTVGLPQTPKLSALRCARLAMTFLDPALHESLQDFLIFVRGEDFINDYDG
jgi:hypothetical protein